MIDAHAFAAADERLRDRARGAVLASAAGDALGAGYEFGTAPLGPDGPAMIGGGLGGFAPGQWTDDTSMAWCLLDALADGADLGTLDGLTEVARRFRAWYDAGPPDVGIQTRAVLAAAGPHPSADAMLRAAAQVHAQTGRSGGNGSLMRTGPVALAYLDDPDALADAARAASDLTHRDEQAGDACVLWSLAIRHAILYGEFDLRSQLDALDPEPAAYWTARIDEAEDSAPSQFTPNGWVVTALQAAWSAIVHTPVPTKADAGDNVGERHLRETLTTAIAIGDDTDTVAAIAGALLGARWGASAVPQDWRAILHGYPGLRADDLLALADRALR